MTLTSAHNGTRSTLSDFSIVSNGATYLACHERGIEGRDGEADHVLAFPQKFLVDGSALLFSGQISFHTELVNGKSIELVDDGIVEPNQILSTTGGKVS